MSNRYKVSIIVPIHQGSSRLQAIREAVASSTTPVQLIIVINNKCLEGTICPGGPHEKVVLAGRMGRGGAFVRGAQEVEGDVVLLLHSDTVPPLKWDEAIARALEDGQIVGGAFSLSYDVSSLYLKLLIFMSNAFVRLTGEMWGDRAIFVRTEVLQQCLTLMDVPLLEDVRLSKCMNGCGKAIVLREKVVTSADGFRREGMVRHAWRALKCRLWYALGGDLERMYEYYYS